MRSYTKNITLITVVMFFLLDRLFKTLAQNGLESDILGSFFRFNFAPNYFISFSLPLTGPILNIGVMIIIAIIIVKFSQRILDHRYDNISILLLTLIAGGISNLIDRLRYGYVIDYLDLSYFTVFNIADAMIVVSSIALIMIYKKKNSSQSPPPSVIPE